MFIRSFKKSDIPELKNLIGEMIEYDHQLDPYYKSFKEYRNFEEEMENWLSDKEMKVLVAEDGGQLIGYFRVGMEEAPDYAAMPTGRQAIKKIGIVYDVFVEKRYRRKGIAAKLFEEALKWFRIKKAGHLELNVDVRNAEAIAFWKKLGFLEYKLRMKWVQKQPPQREL